MSVVDGADPKEMEQHCKDSNCVHNTSYRQIRQRLEILDFSQLSKPSSELLTVKTLALSNLMFVADLQVGGYVSFENL